MAQAPLAQWLPPWQKPAGKAGEHAWSMLMTVHTPASQASPAGQKPLAALPHARETSPLAMQAPLVQVRPAAQVPAGAPLLHGAVVVVLATHLSLVHCSVAVQVTPPQDPLCTGIFFPQAARVITAKPKRKIALFTKPPSSPNDFSLRSSSEWNDVAAREYAIVAA